MGAGRHVQALGAAGVAFLGPGNNGWISRGYWMDVSIIIISFNTRELTLACLRSIFDQTRGIHFEIIVLDNASEDGSAKAVQNAYPNAKLIALERNVGFAKGNNLAVAEARGEFLLLLNPDTEILDGAVQKVVAFARSLAAPSIVGGRTFFADGSLSYNSCHGRPTPWSAFCMGFGLSAVFRRSRLFDPESLGPWQRDTVREVDAITGCFMLINRILWEQFGGFDESFFMYGEDTDLCIRARKAGSRCVICPEARLIHYGGKSERLRADKMVKLFGAKAQLIEKHWRTGTVWFGLAMLKLWALTRMVACGAAATRVKSARISYGQWKDVWARRAEYGGKVRAMRNFVGQ
jgi:N-acetylglucosaminyl-diphospho-decaprenol L-rhamnosyltransferase